MTYSLEEKVKLFAIYSRLGVIFLQFVTNIFVPDHDAGVFQKPLDIGSTNTFLDVIVKTILGGLTRWDGQYFLHIAEYGYTYENSLAFFPLFPLIIRHLTYVLLYTLNFTLGCFVNISSILSVNSMLVLVSVFFNNYIFVKNSVVLYKLSLLVLKSEKLAYISAILFCINPASIFFSACYSESLYCFLVFYGLLKIEEKNSLVNFIIIGMTGIVRSNGLINTGFLFYKYIKLRCTEKIPFFYNIIFNFGIILSVLPFLIFQLYSYTKFCLPNEVALPEFIYVYGQSNGLVFPGSNSSWCHEPFPFAYRYVQKHYWNVGFLKYYEIKQIPNFLLAAPIIYIMIQGTCSFVKHYKHLVFYLGFVKGDPGNELPITAFPYILHAAALTVFAIFIIHIQVATRLLASSTPVPYWYCSRAFALSLPDPVEIKVLKNLKKTDCFYERISNKKSCYKTFLLTETFKGFPLFIKWYFLIYLFVGTFMFSNYLPWT